MLNSRIKGNLSSVGAKAIDVHLGTVFVHFALLPFDNSEPNGTRSNSLVALRIEDLEGVRAFHVLHQNSADLRRQSRDGGSSCGSIH